jgi:gustatory receptor
LSIILPIDSTVQKAKQFIDLCYKMQEKFTCESEETSVLTKLANDSKNYTRDFSAAGFFTINKSIIFSMVGTVTTYFIITIQLNESQYKKIS